MIFYKKPFILNDEIKNKNIQNIAKVFRNGNFNEARKQLALIDSKNLNKEELEELEKLNTMINIDKAGIFAVLFLLVIIIYLFISF